MIDDLEIVQRIAQFVLVEHASESRIRFHGDHAFAMPSDERAQQRSLPHHDHPPSATFLSSHG
jgi:hypothetical protein